MLCANAFAYSTEWVCVNIFASRTHLHQRLEILPTLDGPSSQVLLDFVMLRIAAAEQTEHKCSVLLAESHPAGKSKEINWVIGERVLLPFVGTPVKLKPLTERPRPADVRLV